MQGRWGLPEGIGELFQHEEGFLQCLEREGSQSSQATIYKRAALAFFLVVPLNTGPIYYEKAQICSGGWFTCATWPGLS